jgi:uncharacterized protein (DUF342 family)
MTDELKPCPFCGSEATMNERNAMEEFVNCSKPGCSLSETWAVAIFIDNWNTRPREDALTAELDKRERQVKNLNLALQLCKDVVVMNAKKCGIEPEGDVAMTMVQVMRSHNQLRAALVEIRDYVDNIDPEYNLPTPKDIIEGMQSIAYHAVRHGQEVDDED